MEECTKLSPKTHTKVIELMVAEATFPTSLVPKLRGEKEPFPIVFTIVVVVACGFGFLFGAII